MVKIIVRELLHTSKQLVEMLELAAFVCDTFAMIDIYRYTHNMHGLKIS